MASLSGSKLKLKGSSVKANDRLQYDEFEVMIYSKKEFYHSTLFLNIFFSLNNVQIPTSIYIPHKNNWSFSKKSFSNCDIKNTKKLYLLEMEGAYFHW